MKQVKCLFHAPTPKVSVADALTNVTSYTYDERGHKLTQTDANTHITTWTYDKFGRQVSRTLPMGQSETFVYNTDGTLATKTDFNGDTTTYSYDPVYKRLETVSYADGTSESYTYDPVSGRRLTATNSNGTTSYEYYPVTGRLATVTNPDLSFVSYNYDSAGNRKSVTTPSGTTSYTYDSLNRIFEVVDKYGHMTGYEYNIHGKPHITTNGNGTVSENIYDELGRLTYLENRKSDGTVISSYSYSLDNIGNRTMVIENSGKTVEYVYDVLHRLTQEITTETDSSVNTITHTYDNVGNRLTKVEGGIDTTYVYDDNDRLTNEGTATYIYDNNGNTLSRTDGAEIVTYSYDSRNRLIGVEKGSDILSYLYNNNGIRVRKTLNGTVTNYLVDSNRSYAQVLEERDSVGAENAYYVYGNDLISQVKFGTQSFFHYDGHGSTRSLTSEMEDVWGSYDYDAYGNLTSQSGTSTDYLYSGEQYDSDLDQYYLRARYYNQNVGRFSSMDSWGGSLSNPITLNKYLYGNGNPVMNYDPSGHFSVMGMMASINVERVLIMSAIPMIAGFISGCSSAKSSLMWLTHLKTLENVKNLQNELLLNIFPEKTIRLLRYFDVAIESNQNDIESLTFILHDAYSKIYKGMSDMNYKDYVTDNDVGIAEVRNKQLPIYIHKAFWNLPNSHKVDISKDGALIHEASHIFVPTRYVSTFMSPFVK